jgi:hypothetical protein
MPVMRDVVRTVPSTGMAPLSSMDSSPCTSMAQLKSPIIEKAPPPTPTMTAKVGSTCWSMCWLFSVVNCSSWAGSTDPAPTPTA